MEQKNSYPRAGYIPGYAPEDLDAAKRCFEYWRLKVRSYDNRLAHAKTDGLFNALYEYRAQAHAEEQRLAAVVKSMTPPKE